MENLGDILDRVGESVEKMGVANSEAKFRAAVTAVLLCTLLKVNEIGDQLEKKTDE